MNVATEAGEELLVGFIDESLDALQELPGNLDDFRQDPQASDAINTVFRAIHSIKGNASFFGLTAIKKFSHSLENTLDDIRNAKLTLGEDLQRELIDGIDMLDGMLQGITDGIVEEELGPAETELLDRIEKITGVSRIDDGGSEEELLSQLLQIADEMGRSSIPEAAQWADRLRCMVASEDADPEGEQCAEESAPQTEPDSLAEAQFHCAGEDVTDRVRELLKLFAAVHGNQFTDEVGDAFLQSAQLFAEWSEAAGQQSLCDALRAAANDFRTIHESQLDVDATLISIVWDHLWPELVKLTDVVEESPAETPPQATEDEPVAEKKQEEAPKQAAGPARTKTHSVRVNEERLNEFLEDVSSLFITGEQLKDLQSRMTQAEAIDGLAEELRQINRTFASQAHALQQRVAAVRKVAVRGLLGKFPKMARSLAASLGKKVDVQIVGEETEVDKSLIDDLDAPLTHMVRNVVDHGIEPPEERLARGVDEAGTMLLKAELQGTRVVITVQDDGRGIDPDKLRDKAVEKKILSRSQADAMPDDEAVELIFHPGFSTAKTISDVSGRGVGLDVVRTTLRDHDGDVHVQSKLGVGTTFRLEIPIRQAVVVIEGLLVKYAAETFVVPFEHITEICELSPSDLGSVQGARVATVHGKLFAAVSLGELLGLPSSPGQNGDAIQAILLECKEGSICLLVDQILGQRKIVVNSLTEILPGTDKMAGVTQLGSHQLSLVLNPPELVKSVRAEREHTSLV